MKRIGIVIASFRLCKCGQCAKRVRTGHWHRRRSRLGCWSGRSGRRAKRIAGASGSTNLPNSSLLGGELPGGVKVKLGDKVINLRGNVGVGDNGGNFKAGVGLPF
jgi:hypothetical protein